MACANAAQSRSRRSTKTRFSATAVEGFDKNHRNLRPHAQTGYSTVQTFVLCCLFWARSCGPACSTSSFPRDSFRFRIPASFKAIFRRRAVHLLRRFDGGTPTSNSPAPSSGIPTLRAFLFIGVDRTNTTLNSGRILINLKPTISAIRRRRGDAAHPEQHRLPIGITLYMQPVQDLTIEGTVSKTQYQFHPSRTPIRCSSPNDPPSGRQAGAASAALAMSPATSPITGFPIFVPKIDRDSRPPASAYAGDDRHALYDS